MYKILMTEELKAFLDALPSEEGLELSETIHRLFSNGYHGNVLGASDGGSFIKVILPNFPAYTFVCVLKIHRQPIRTLSPSHPNFTEIEEGIIDFYKVQQNINPTP